MKKLLFALFAIIMSGSAMAELPADYKLGVEFTAKQWETVVSPGLQTHSVRTITLYVDWGDGVYKEFTRSFAGDENSYSPITGNPVSSRNVKMYFKEEDAQAFKYIFIPSATSFDAAKLINLTKIRLKECSITHLDFSNYPKLENISISENPNITEIILSNNPELERFECDQSNIEAIDLSKNAKLKSLTLTNSPKLTNLDLTNNTQLTYLSCRDNNLTFASLNTTSAYRDQIEGSFYYWSQGNVQIDKNYEKGKPIDLNYTGNEKYVWKKVSNNSTLTEGIDYTIENGVTTFKRTVREVYCEITNDNFGNLKLRTTNTEILFSDVAAKIELDDALIDIGQEYQIDLAGSIVELEVRWHNPDSEIEIIEFHNTATFTVKSHTFDIYVEDPERINLLSANNLAKIDVTPLTRLIYLNCNANSLSQASLQSLDLSKNTKLERLDCSDNKIENLDLNNNLELEWINCSYNNIKSLNLNNNSELEYLGCSGNKIESLNLSKNKKLTWIYCSNNNIKELNLSDNKKLEYLSYSYNKIESLDLSQNTLLASLDCSGNKIENLNLSKNTLLTSLNCFGNKLTFTSLETTEAFINNLTDFYYSPQADIIIKESYAVGDQIDLSHSGAKLYEWFTSAGDKLVESTDYTVSNGITTFKKAVDNVYCEMTHGEFEDLTLKARAKFDNLVAKIELDPALVDIGQEYTISLYGADHELDINWHNEDSEIESIIDYGTFTFTVKSHAFDIYAKNTKEIGYLGANDLAKIDVTSLTGLTEIRFSASNSDYPASLQSLNLSNNTQLKRLYCSYNKIENLNLSNNTLLTSLYCDNNKIESLDLNNNAQLEWIDCSQNNIESLDLSNNTSLIGLFCYYNKIESLDLSNNTSLESLACLYNNIESLDLSKNTELEYLDCSHNKIESLDLNNNAQLEWLFCENNKLTFTDLKTAPTINEEDEISKFNYSPQADIEIETNYAAGDPIDLSHSGAEEGGYKWFTSADVELTENEDYTITDGVTKFKNIVGEVYCQMTHNDFPELTLKSTLTTISQGTSIGENQSSTKIVGETAAIRITTDVEAQYRIINTSGVVLAQGTAQGEEVINLPQGIYIVKIGETTEKVIVK